MRGEEGEDLEGVQEFFAAVGAGFETDVHEDDAMVRVADDFFDELVAALAVAVGVADAERVGVDVFKAGQEVALFFMDEARAIGDEQLHVAGLGMIDGGVVDFVERAVETVNQMRLEAE